MHGSFQHPWKALEALPGWQRREDEHRICLSHAAAGKYEPLVSLPVSPAVCSSAKSTHTQKRYILLLFQVSWILLCTNLQMNCLSVD